MQEMIMTPPGHHRLFVDKMANFSPVFKQI